jgi:hypothetical protein
MKMAKKSDAGLHEESLEQELALADLAYKSAIERGVEPEEAYRRYVEPTVRPISGDK